MIRPVPGEFCRKGRFLQELYKGADLLRFMVETNLVRDFGQTQTKFLTMHGDPIHAILCKLLFHCELVGVGKIMAFWVANGTTTTCFTSIQEQEMHICLYNEMLLQEMMAFNICKCEFWTMCFTDIQERWIQQGCPVYRANTNYNGCANIAQLSYHD